MHLLLAVLLCVGVPPVRAVLVPPALAARTSPPELSGLAWSPALGRYLVVSDDTGKKSEGTNHAPFVLALSPEGTLDEEVVPIEGIESLNDAEAIGAGPGETFFIVTSHSPTREGHSRPARRQLLHVALRERALHVLGRADMTQLEGGTLESLAGLPSEGLLDIEAVAYREGSLFLGLKAPLSRGREALIFEVSDAIAELSRGAVRASAVRLWRSLRLCPGSVCQGISDLAFLPDGSLLVAANAPKGAPADGGGSLFHVVPGHAPRLLRRFPGLKPEGVALSPRDSVVLVFDRDQSAPLWLEMPRP